MKFPCPNCGIMLNGPKSLAPHLRSCSVQFRGSATVDVQCAPCVPTGGSTANHSSVQKEAEEPQPSPCDVDMHALMGSLLCAGTDEAEGDDGFPLPPMDDDPPLPWAGEVAATIPELREGAADELDRVTGEDPCELLFDLRALDGSSLLPLESSLAMAVTSNIFIFEDSLLSIRALSTGLPASRCFSKWWMRLLMGMGPLL